MKRTDTSNPDYFHKVVDCQWGCPAHTDVPEYIRLIAQGRFTDAYMVNRESNIFPGILGRVCDRPCEPACRRGRMDEKPVAICRLKRVAADHKQDISERLPLVPAKKNGKKIALVGAGPASLAVCNDLMPLGYECTVFEAQSVAGGLMRYNIPAFRLPASVLDEEIDTILDMGVEIHYDHRIESMKALLDEGYDAVFVGTGAPRGKELKLPGRYDAEENIFIGIDWLESVAFGHIDSIGENVLIIGVGNTAMDCCRTSLRLGAKNVKVMARKPREFFKASDWELEDAEEENVEIVVNHSPKDFVVEDGQLKGMTFELMEYEIENGRILEQRVTGEVFIPCDDVILAIGQENSFPWIERDLGIEFNKWEEPIVDEVTYQSTLEGVFFGGDSAFGPKNIIWAVEHAHQAAVSIHRHCQGESLTDRLPPTLNLGSRKMGIHEWSYSNNFSAAARRKMMHVPLEVRFDELGREVELGFDAEQTAQEVERCLNCDIQTVFTDSLCIECDACLDICPTQCLTIARNGEREDLVQRLKAPVLEPEQPLFVSDGLKQTGRVMVKDENFCIHCGLCAERCPTAAWDMQKSWLKFPQATDYAGGCNTGESPCQQRKAG
ncbi:MAG: FAD-dependent oxidoreductase [Lysobacterales bacterium]|jgi:NADPH-dependent glutamate synthase beta subunit-like oxidoreductase